MYILIWTNGKRCQPFVSLHGAKSGVQRILSACSDSRLVVFRRGDEEHDTRIAEVAKLNGPLNFTVGFALGTAYALDH